MVALGDTESFFYLGVNALAAVAFILLLRWRPLSSTDPVPAATA